MELDRGNLGATITTALGARGLFAPAWAAAFTRLSPIGPTGTSEIRATYGGLFARLGLACLFSPTPPVYPTAGVAWTGAAHGRTWSVIIDRDVDGKNLGGTGFELAIGLLLPAPSWTGAGSRPGHSQQSQKLNTRREGSLLDLGA